MKKDAKTIAGKFGIRGRVLEETNAPDRGR